MGVSAIFMMGLVIMCEGLVAMDSESRHHSSPDDSYYMAASGDLDPEMTTEQMAANQLEVLTFNIMWEENGIRAGDTALPVWQSRKRLVIAMINDVDPDIIGLQEASIEQQADLRTDLPKYEIVYDNIANNTNPILFKKSRFRLVRSETFILNAEPEMPGTNIGVRKATWCQLEDKSTKSRFNIYNLHLDSRSKGRTKHVSAIRLMERMLQDPDPTIIVGDFNSRDSSSTMSFFYGRTALYNDQGLHFVNPRPFRNVFRLTHPDRGTDLVDHILVDEELTVLDSMRIESGNASDHPAVSTNLSVQNDGPNHRVGRKR